MRVVRHHGSLPFAAGLIALCGAWGASSAGPGQVDEIIVLGLSRMTRQAFLHAFGIKVGEPYDEGQIRARFRELWELRLFEDLTVEAEDSPDGGRALIVKVKERPTVTAITYEDSRVVSRTQIEDALKERDIGLAVGKPLDLGAVYFAESAIRDLFAQRGHLDAEVRAEVRRVTETSRAVHFSMTAGGKTRIRRIDFTGNELFHDRRLKRQLKLTQERKWYWPWSSKNLYHPIKWDQDVSAIRDLYQNNGYLDIEIRAPIVEVRHTKRGAKKAERAQRHEQRRLERRAAAASREPPAEELTPEQAERRAKKQAKLQKKEEKRARKAEKRWVYLTVPVGEGEQYKLGQIEITGNVKFSDDPLRRQIPLVDGGVLNNGLLNLGVDRISRLYEDAGHLYSTVVRRIERREGERVADVVVTVDEDEPYWVGRIAFQGNTETHDRVLRRELQLVEGDLFSRTRLDLSRAKVNQLGYFQINEEPVIEPIEGQQQVQITFPGTEQGRNEINVGGGFSGVDGAFFNGVYSTRNFLGRGQIVSARLQIGGRASRYQLSFQEPWFLGKPYLLGVNLFRRDTDYGSSLSSSGQGAGIVLGRRLTRFSRLNLAYNFENVTSRSVAGSGLSAVVIEAESEISSLTPIFSYTTVNNPYRPSRGTDLSLSVQVAGGPLGGTVSFLRPLLSYTRYRRAFGRTFFGFHGEAGVVRELTEPDIEGSSANIEGVPRFQRFWLGGDTLGPRVFETRSITPRRYVRLDGNQIVEVLGDPTGQSAGGLLTSGGVPIPIEVGGDRMYLVQSELVWPLNEQADLALFFDAGDALFEDTSISLDTLRASAGFEMRFHIPIFPVPLRLIYGFPLRKLEGDRTSNFTFSIGRSF